MNVLCKMFGHKPPVYAEKGWWTPSEQYGILKLKGFDGIGRQHADVLGDCARCGRSFLIAKVHVPTIKK